MANEDGTNLRRLTVHTARESFPRFSPDGKWMAVVRASRDAEFKREAWLEVYDAGTRKLAHTIRIIIIILWLPMHLAHFVCLTRLFCL